MNLTDFYQEYGVDATYQIIDHLVIDELNFDEGDALDFLINLKVATKATKTMKTRINRNYGSSTIHNGSHVGLGRNYGKFGRSISFINGAGSTKLRVATHDYEIQDIIKEIASKKVGIA